MLRQYEDLRNEIRHYAAKEKNYEKALQLLFEYLNNIKGLSCDLKEDKKWIFYEIALQYKKLGQFEKAIPYSLKSLNYLDISDYQCSKYPNRLWLIAGLYESINNIDEAKRLYYQCSYLFKKLDEQKNRALVIFNNAKIMKNFRAMKSIIRIYETGLLKTTIITHGDMEYDDVLKSLYQELIELYIVESKNRESLVSEIFRVIYAVKSKSFRRELSVKLCA